MEKTGGIRQVLVKIFCAGALVIFSWFFLASFFSFSGRSCFWIPIALLLLALVCGLTVLLERREISPRLFWTVSLCTGAGLLLLQAAAGYLLMLEPSWDFGGVYLSAYEYVVRGRVITHEHYFERFSNNTGLLLWEIVLFKVLRFLGAENMLYYNVAGILMNIAVIDLSILFTVLFCRRIWDSRRALLVLALCVLFTPYVLYSPIFYTDSLSLIFIALPLYLFSFYLKEERLWARAALGVSIGLLLSFGAKVKGSVAILLVAFCLYAAFNFGVKRLACFLLAAVVPFAGFSRLFDRQVVRMGIIKEENVERFNFPAEYWVYMGLKSPGGFHNEDFEEIYALKSRTERQQAGRAGIAKRLGDLGPGGMLKHLTEKSAYTFGDGSYFVGLQLERKPLRDTWLFPYFQANTSQSIYYRVVADAYQGLILLALLVGLALDLARKKGFGVTTLLYAALFGLTLFLMVWETRSRYLLNFTPVMLILMGNGIWEGFTLLKARVRAKKEGPAAESQAPESQT